ncbi:Aste57867_18354 [Aphanomyces stellatus]|uniref:Aste57867_18354 protein n=1 Tax=Aphanomyces stellatus TaxID=120398 RepID=A0A485LDL0_9STRA|nr:hypothetical protein As57867_018292 [Aphanomyces stellatus]VFT95090.1 Aste57867_18354 [Aphanomyces stellatus]
MNFNRLIFLIWFPLVVVAIWVTALWFNSLTSYLSAFDGAPIDQTQPNRRRSVDEKRAMTIAFVQKQLQENPAIPGVSISVVYQNETIIATGFGTKQHGNKNTPVTDHTVFQIGSYTKTFIALGIGKLVDDGLVQWHDPVQQHLPWFHLVDKYAEQYTTLGDLLAMNSVFGEHEGDGPMMGGVFSSERDLVERMAYLNTTRPIRAGYAYSNLNFEILGQVIEHVTHQPWFAFIKTTFLDPLGMNDTFGRPADVTNMAELSSGHFACKGQVLGPYDITSSMAAFTAGADYLAAASMLSSAADLAKFSHFLLNRGRGIFKSAQIIQEMTTGHTILANYIDGVDANAKSFHPDGGVKAAGYGFDTVGNVMYGYDFYDKTGATLTMHHNNGFVPSQGLGVAITSNVRMDVWADFYRWERVRAYVLGIFLDVPQVTLDDTWSQALLHVPFPSGMPCDAYFYRGQTWGRPIPVETQTLLVGTYVATDSPRYNGNLTVFKQGHELMLHYGAYTKPLLATLHNPTTEFVWTVDVDASTMVFTLKGLHTSSQTLALSDAALFVKATT